MNFENDAKEAEAAGDYLAAIDYYLLVLESVDDINSLSDPPFYFGNICSRLAYLYSEVGDLVSTVKYLRKAVKSCLESSEPLTKVYPKVGDCYTNLGVCFLAKANYKMALGYFSKAVEFNEECLNLGEDEILQYVAECAVFNYSLSTLSSITLTSKRHDLLPYLLKAISLSETHEIKGFAADLCHFFLHLVNEELNNAIILYKEKILKAIAIPLPGFVMKNIVMGTIIELATAYLPSMQVQVHNKPEDLGAVILTRKMYEDMLLFGLSFANRKLLSSNYQEVIALIIGRIEKNDVIISEIIPMASGTEMEVQFKEEHYVKAEVINAQASERGEFIVGWFHTHPSLGLFMSATDILNHLGYQSVNEKAIAIEFDFTQMTPSNSGFAIFRLDKATLATAAYHKVDWRISDAPKNFNAECLFFFSKFIATINHVVLKNQKLSLEQLSKEVNRSEMMLEKILPKLIELEYLPALEYNSEAKTVLKKGFEEDISNSSNQT